MPIIPIIAGSAVGGGISALAWYWNLTSEERKEADKRTAEYIHDKYHAVAAKLTREQAIAALKWATGRFT